MLSNQELFDKLEGRQINVLNSGWQIEVCGIHQAKTGGHRWIQLSVKGLPNRLLTVSLSPRDGVQRVVSALATWMANGVVPASARVA